MSETIGRYVDTFSSFGGYLNGIEEQNWGIQSYCVNWGVNDSILYEKRVGGGHRFSCCPIKKNIMIAD